MSERKPRGRIFDKEEVKRAAQNRWADVFTQLAGLDPQILDEINHPCPKCEGVDRFRMIDKAAGALFCNQCFNTKSGDGIAAVQWLLDIDFKTALAKIADHLGVQPKQKAAGSVKAKSKPAVSPCKFFPFDENVTEQNIQAKEFCNKIFESGLLSKKAINSQGVKRLDAKLGLLPVDKKYANEHDALTDSKRKNSCAVATLGIPVYHPDGGQSWKMRRCSGEQFPPRKQKGGEGKPSKSLSEYGHGYGIMGSTDGEIVFLCEGEIDLLAIYSVLPDDSKYSAFSPKSGQGPRVQDSTLEKLNGKTVVCFYDKSEHAAKRCEEIAQKTDAVVKDCNFESYGMDLEEWLQAGNTFDNLLKIVDECEPYAAGDKETFEMSKLSEEDPRRVAWENLKSYEANGRRLVFWQGRWFRYKQNHYRDIRMDELIPKVRKFVEAEYVRIWDQLVENYVPKSEGDEPPRHPKSVKDRTVKEVISAMEAICYISNETTFPGWIGSPEKSTENIIPLKNGLLDVKKLIESKTNKTANVEFFFPHTSDFFSPTCLDYEYRELDAADEGLTKSNFWEFLNKSFPGPDGLKYRTLLQEWAGYLLTSDNSFKVFMVFQGTGDNGKGVFLTIMKSLLGKQNCSSVELSKLAASFSAANYYDKLLNICDESSGISDDSLNTIKRLSGGSDVNVNAKFERAFDTECRCRFMLCCNEMPEFKDSSQATANRLLFIPWDNVVREDEKRREFMSTKFWKESGELELILSWAIDGLIRLHRQNGFTYSEEQKAVSRELAQGSPELDWFEHFFNSEKLKSTGDVDDFISIDEILDNYKHYVKSAGCRPKYSNKSSFGRFLKEALRGQDDFKNSTYDRRRVNNEDRVTGVFGLRKIKSLADDVVYRETSWPKPILDAI